MDQVVLVDALDNETGTMEKIAAHKQGLLHRAFSVFLFDSKGRMLLQKRALSKYHSGGLWSNSCCSHPRPGEMLAASVARRLHEEMGISCPVEECFSFLYHAELDNYLTEHEYDHVFVGVFDGMPVANPREVMDWRYVSLELVLEELEMAPDKFSYWFRAAIPLLLKQPAIRSYLPGSFESACPA